MEPLTGGPAGDAGAPVRTFDAGAPVRTFDADAFPGDVRPGPDGVARPLPPRPDGRPVAAVNRSGLVARLYDPVWRVRSTALLTAGRFGTRRETERMTAWLAAGPGDRVLDVGCGSGFYLRALHAASPDARLHGLDASEAFLAVARSRLDRDRLPVTLALGDAERLPYRDAAFDAAAWGGTLNEVRDREAAWRELARVVRPGGRIWTMATVRATSWVGRAAQAPARLGGLSIPPAEAVLDEAEAAGLRVLRAERRPPLLVALLERPDVGAADRRAPAGRAAGPHSSST